VIEVVAIVTLREVGFTESTNHRSHQALVAVEELGSAVLAILTFDFSVLSSSMSLELAALHCSPTVTLSEISFAVNAVEFIGFLRDLFVAIAAQRHFCAGLG